MLYLMWYDDNAKKATEAKIAEAIEAYQQRFHGPPNVVLVNEAEMASVAGVLVRAERYIRKSNFWVGWEGVLS